MAAQPGGFFLTKFQPGWNFATGMEKLVRQNASSGWHEAFGAISRLPGVRRTGFVAGQAHKSLRPAYHWYVGASLCGTSLAKNNQRLSMRTVQPPAGWRGALASPCRNQWRRALRCHRYTVGRRRARPGRKISFRHTRLRARMDGLARWSRGNPISRYSAHPP